MLAVYWFVLLRLSTFFMRLVVSYLTSAALHLGAYALLCVCLPLLHVANQMQVTSGKPICVVMALPSPDSVIRDEALPVKMELPVEPDQPPVEIEPQKVPLKFPTDLRPASYKTPLVEVATVEHPRPQQDTLPPRALPPNSPPPTPHVAPEPLPKKLTTPDISIASTALPFQAESDLGLEVDELPTKLPTNVPPIYPPDALAARIEGRVILRVKVSADGSVAATRLETTSGHPQLDRSALTAVAQWRFTPARQGGKPVEFEILVPVNFLIFSE